jgi:hypothetical protein
MYCKFCGSTEVKTIRETTTNNQGKSLRVSIVPNLVDEAISNHSTDQIEYSNTYCDTCKKTSAAGNNAPFVIIIKVREIYFHFLLPYTLIELFRGFNINESRLKRMLENMTISIDRIFRKYTRSGTNPCKRYKIGYKKVLNLNGQRIYVWILLSNLNNGRKLVRFVYGGGKSFCM